MKELYSEKEFLMIKKLDPWWATLIEENKDSSVCTPTILESIALQCFINNKTGPAVDSLRRCIKDCRNCNPYRMTPEYDDLIKLD